MKPKVVLSAVAAGIAGVAAHDLTQKRHSLMRNFPVIAHARFALEEIGPELRQYIVTGNDEERPFSRDQRSWIYASSKMENNYTGFGTDNDVENAEYVIFKHHTFAPVAAPTGTHAADDVWLPCGKILGGPRGRRDAFRPDSVVNISAMSFGSLSGNAIAALNGGAKLAGCLHNTGEGGLSAHHRQGGDLTLQIGTAYFGCRDDEGRFDLDTLMRVVESAPVKAIEIKLSQGAKPGLGGMLPAAKITPEIAEIRGIPLGKDCASPSRHAEFNDVDSMLDFVERIAQATGKPVGIKSAIGEMGFWESLAGQMQSRSRGVDFITVDGGEGGTGAAPLVFTDAVALPFRVGFARVYSLFAEAGLSDDVVFIGSGKLGLPDNALVAFALGADMVNVAREAMMSIGCIQAQKCHTDHCPTGVATQSTWLARGLDPTLKAERAANYIRTLRRDLLKVSEACGVWHPSLLDADDVEIMDGNRRGTPLRVVYGYQPTWGAPGPRIRDEITALMSQTAPAGGSAPSTDEAVQAVVPSES
ncbi:MAG TPA: FMN-binding glutamate synthase family protein [Tetrasphaera sp.]|uniref:FMN-binding glutamate synthase family protein n=1 Tax=Nostocoides sp. TaxID=1917966 RepID=UPI002B94EA09|nr:FMN-binding glutamate synthase family protein [Tetrasphaera sp.]HNQ06976.1 FMN-binding glutamate synthase family protein [Tetrasphaera sp.]